MCGITGIIGNLDPIEAVAKIKKMNDVISHRGPDSEGFFCDDKVFLGHRRLSIIDISDQGIQPMGYGDNLTITYNGEIYNYNEIKNELISDGYKFSNNTDTEVILAAYDKWGTDCFTKFNGMWAFALYDRRKNIVILSRDRFGVKPIYCVTINNIFYFASEIKQLLCILNTVKINESNFLDVMISGFENFNNETLFKDIFSLEQGCYHIINLENMVITTEKYYDLHEEIKKNNFQNIEYFEILKSAVQLRMRADVQVGTCLSGGLDSSCISALASKIFHSDTTEKFLAIHAKATEKNIDESSFAELVAKYLELELNTVTPSFETFIKNIDELVYVQEEMFGTSQFMGYEVFKEAKLKNCIVMLNGQGADETLLGYERYYVDYFNGLSFKEKFLNFFHIFSNSRLSLKNWILYLVYFNFTEIRKIYLLRKSFLRRDFRNKVKFEALNILSKAQTIEDKQILEVSKIQLPHLLRYEDRNSMRHSIETRLPFLDFRCVEKAISLRIEEKINGGWTKNILRNSFNNLLPKEVLWRKNKFGFEAPEKSWLSLHKEEMIESIQSSKIINKYFYINQLCKDFEKLNTKDQWRFFVISRWEKVFKITV